MEKRNPLSDQQATFTTESTAVTSQSITADPRYFPLYNYLQSGKILLIDDDIKVQGIISESLSAYGYRVRVADDVIEAIRCVEEDSEICCLIVDLTTSNFGANVLYAKMRRMGKTIPIIFTSALISEERLMVLAGGENFNFLQKPYAAEEVVEKIQKRNSDEMISVFSLN